MTLPIPNELLPVPRLVVWHGDPEDAADERALVILRRTYHQALKHGMFDHGQSAGGNDWSGWHISDAAAIAGLASVARNVAPSHWTILEETL